MVLDFLKKIDSIDGTRSIRFLKNSGTKIQVELLDSDQERMDIIAINLASERKNRLIGDKFPQFDQDKVLKKLLQWNQDITPAHEKKIPDDFKFLKTQTDRLVLQYEDEFYFIEGECMEIFSLMRKLGYKFDYQEKKEFKEELIVTALKSFNRCFFDIDFHAGKDFTLIHTESGVLKIDRNGVEKVDNGYQSVVFMNPQIKDFLYIPETPPFLWIDYFGETHAAWFLQSLVLSLEVPYFPLISMGDPGTGKTHIFNEISYILYKDQRLVKMVVDDVKDLASILLNNKFVCFDDSAPLLKKCGKDIIIAIQHDRYSERMLYRNGIEFCDTMKANMAFTMVEPERSFSANPGLHDRAIIRDYTKKIEKRDRKTKSSMLKEIQKNRNLILSSLINFVVLYHSTPDKIPVELERMSDVHCMVEKMKFLGVNIDFTQMVRERDIALLERDGYYKALLEILHTSKSKIQAGREYTARELSLLPLIPIKNPSKFSEWLSKNRDLLESLKICVYEVIKDKHLHRKVFRWTDTGVTQKEIILKEIEGCVSNSTLLKNIESILNKFL